MTCYCYSILKRNNTLSRDHFVWQLFIHMLCEQCTHMYKLFVALGKLRLKVPWSNLYSAPVVVEVDGVYIVAGPLSGEFWDRERERESNFVNCLIYFIFPQLFHIIQKRSWRRKKKKSRENYKRLMKQERMLWKQKVQYVHVHPYYVSFSFVSISTARSWFCWEACHSNH